MRTSEKIDLISKAMVSVQAGLGIAVKDKDNPHFKSKYADFGSIVSASRAQLILQDIAIIQGCRHTQEAGWMLVTRLAHGEQWIESDYPLIAKDPTNPQALVSATTYAKRTHLALMLGVVSDEDDDGNAATSQSDDTFDSVQLKNHHCNNCGSVMKLTKKGDSLYCPNFKDTSKGEHDYVRL